MTISKCLILKHPSKSCMNVYFWHEHSHVKDSNASDPSEWPRPSPGQTLENGKDYPGQIQDTADLLLKSVHTGNTDRPQLPHPRGLQPQTAHLQKPPTPPEFPDHCCYFSNWVHGPFHAIWMELVSVISSFPAAPVRSIMWLYQNA